MSVAHGLFGSLGSRFGQGSLGESPTSVSTESPYNAAMWSATAGPGPGLQPPAALRGPEEAERIGNGTLSSADPSKHCLTAGLPTPDAIMQQKDLFAQSLEEQLRHGVDVLANVHRQKTEALHTAANERKQQYDQMLEQQVKQQEIRLGQEYSKRLMELQQTAQRRRTELESQAAALLQEWEQRQIRQELFAKRASTPRAQVLPGAPGASLAAPSAAVLIPVRPCSARGRSLPRSASHHAVLMSAPGAVPLTPLVPLAQPMAQYNLPAGLVRSNSSFSVQRLPRSLSLHLLGQGAPAARPAMALPLPAYAFGATPPGRSRSFSYGGSLALPLAPVQPQQPPPSTAEPSPQVSEGAGELQSFAGSTGPAAMERVLRRGAFGPPGT